MAEQNAYSEIPDVALADAMGQLAGGISAMQSELFIIAAEFDRRQAWRDDGVADLATWFRIRFGLSDRTAKDWARVVNDLRELPQCARAFAEGRLSWDQVKPLTLVATPETDARRAADAPGATVAALEREARRAREVTHSEAEEQEAKRHLRWWFQGKDGFRLSGQLPAADGAVVVAALERTAEKLPKVEPDGRQPSYFGRMADSLVAMSSSQVASDRDADRACVVVHVSAETLAGAADGKAELEGGHPIHPEVARRLCCDSRLEVVVEGRDGVPVGVGRATRDIPPWLWRMLLHRDGGRCRFCGATRWLEGHHLVWWSRGGPTDLDNLMVACSRCHKLFHEGGWTIEGNPNGRLTFRRPDGRALAGEPPPVRPAARQALLNAAGAQTLDDLARCARGRRAVHERPARPWTTASRARPGRSRKQSGVGDKRREPG